LKMPERLSGRREAHCPATTSHNHASLGETTTNGVSRSSKSNRSMLRTWCFRPTPPLMAVTVFTCTGVQATAFDMARTTGESPPPRGDADKARTTGESPPPRGDTDKHATAHTIKLRKDTMLRCSPKVSVTSRICTGPETVPTTNIHCWTRNRAHKKSLHLDLNTVTAKSLCTWTRNRVHKK
jgi:hypothetical protein